MKAMKAMQAMQAMQAMKILTLVIDDFHHHETYVIGVSHSTKKLKKKVANIAPELWREEWENSIDKKSETLKFEDYFYSISDIEIL